MKKETIPRPLQSVHSTLITNRLTALWALNEAGLGGIMHAIKSPFTGIFVGGIAIILIALIAYFADKKTTTILKATTIVLIIKAIVSPHSPLPAYLAVGFQGVAGAFLFSILSSYRLAALVLGIAGLSESALQKILTLTFIYGTSLWESIDIFFDYIFQAFGLLGQTESVHISIILISIYFSLYLLAGILIGYLAGIMPTELTRIITQQDAFVTRQLSTLDQSDLSVTWASRPFWSRRIFKISAVVLGIAIVFTILNPELKGIYQAIYVLLRTGVVIAIWYFMAAPVLTRLLRIILNKKRQVYAAEVEQILLILPHLRGATAILWNHSAHFHFVRRLKYFLLTLISYTLTYQPVEKEIDKNDHKSVPHIGE